MGKHDEIDNGVSRRGFIGTTAAGAAVVATGLGKAGTASAQTSLAASPPTGFTPMSAPGKIVKVSRAGSLQPNGLYPKPEAAKAMFEKAMLELTGEKSLGAAFAKFVHKSDKVAVKLNGIAKGKKFGTNKELVDVILAGIIESGVPATSIVVYEQYGSFLAGTRVDQSNVPAGVKCVVHSNKDMATPDIAFLDGKTKIKTKFARPLMEATAVINVSLIKDHAICGYTGCLKNMTHGSINVPHEHHAHHASPQIAKLYAHEAIKSRVRLHITDGYKVMYDGGPVEVVSYVPHEAVYVTTDPVAMDVFGWELVDKIRKEKGMKSLKDVGRDPAYIPAAADLGLGIGDRAKIVVKDFTV
ncbi:MAG: DUF362 domain-containing protein [Deltaproteobacteria bacterium]|nr:DUF362 domain-containing protein [Deltaproteobacteria bacterium]